MSEPVTLFAVPQPLIEKVLTYLAARPYAEVAALIADLMQCQVMPALTVPHEPSNP